MLVGYCDETVVVQLPRFSAYERQLGRSSNTATLCDQLHVARADITPAQVELAHLMGSSINLCKMRAQPRCLGVQKGRGFGIDPLGETKTVDDGTCASLWNDAGYLWRNKQPRTRSDGRQACGMVNEQNENPRSSRTKVRHLCSQSRFGACRHVFDTAEVYGPFYCPDPSPDPSPDPISPHGLLERTTTVFCENCGELQDILAGHYFAEPSDKRPKFHCPNRASHRIRVWNASEGCPRCGGSIENLGATVMWD